MAKKKNKLLKKFKQLKRKTRKRILKIIIVIFLIIIAFLTYKIVSYIDYKINYEKELSAKGQELLDDYEFPWYMVEQPDNCLRPYDVGDGVITFGPGITYNTEEEGIEDINKKYKKDYTVSNNCIDVDILFKLQKDLMYVYEDYVSEKTFEHKVKVNQNEFDALLILAYNSPDFLKDEEVIKMLKNDEHTKKEYIKAINNYYKQIKSYYDNPNTQEPNDGFGQGWYNRIVDSAEVFFDEEYEYQNNSI